MDDPFDLMRAQWGARALGLHCMAVLRFYDTKSRWCCYVLSINPEDNDEMVCIVRGESVEIIEWKFSEMNEMFNADGDGVFLDLEFRPCNASIVYKKLINGEI